MMPIFEIIESNFWLRFLADATLKSVLILAIAGAFAFVLRDQSAALRGLVWSVAMVGCLIVPLCSLALPKWDVGVLPGSSGGYEKEVLIQTNPQAAAPVSIPPHSPASNAVLPTQAAPTPFQPQFAASESNATQAKILAALHWTDWIFAGWALAVLFLIARLITGIGAVWYISARSDDFNDAIEHVQLNLKRRYRFRRSDGVAVPMMWGIFRPVILLPVDADGWGSERLRAVLLHETAHIQRRDWLMQTVVQLTCAVYWFNPLVWIVARQMRAEAEIACDDHVLNTGYRSTEYAQHLIEVVRDLKAFGAASRTAVAMARRSKMEWRLRTVIAEDRNRQPLTTAAVAIGLVVLIGFSVPMGVMRLAEAVDQEGELFARIQAALNFKLEPLPKNAMDEERAARREQYRQNRERGVQLCEQFIKTYPESKRHDEVWYEKLKYFRVLGRDAEFDAGVEVFLSERPSSKYADKLHRLRAYKLESKFKFHDALAEWDKIDDPALLHEVYERKGQIFSRMNNWTKRAEFDLLRAELILGKPAPEFSHTSIDGVPIALADLRGKVVVLYHWSTRDGRTVRDSEIETGGEISILKRLHDIHGKNPNFVLVTVCAQSSEAMLKAFIKTQVMPGIHLLLDHEAVPYQFGVNGWPYYVVVDKAGILRESAHGYALSGLEIEQLVKALLAEDIDVSGERIVPRISLLRAEVYSDQHQDEKAIAEYENLLAFTPNNLSLIMQCLYNKGKQGEQTAALMNRAYERMVELSQLPRNLELDISDSAVELATLFSRQGYRDKSWRLFQIAVVHDEDNLNSAINYAKRDPNNFAAIQDMPEFVKLLAETPQSEADKHAEETNRKRELYAEDRYDALKSFTAVEVDGEIYTGVILSRGGHILVPASVAAAEVVRAKIVDYQSAKVVAVDTESGLGVVQLAGQGYLRPVVLGTVDDLREYAPFQLSNPADGYAFPNISTISARGYPFQRAEIHQQTVGHPIERHNTVEKLEISDNGKVTTMNTSTSPPNVIIKGDAFVYHDGRLLAISLEDEVHYAGMASISNPIPIDQIRTALERMDIIGLMERSVEKPAKEFELVLEAENFTGLDGEEPTVQPFLIIDDSTTSGGAFIVANRALGHQYQIPDTWLTYEIEIPADGDYAIWLYARGYTGKSDSFFVGTDLETPRACDVNRFGLWGAVPAVDRTSPQVVPAFHFTKGLHEIRLFVRETGSELDAMLISNDLSLGAAAINRKIELRKRK